MKKIYSLFSAVALAATVAAQTTVYSENMGTGASGNPTVTAFTGWQNASPISYVGTADVRTTTASTGYANASGGNNVFFAAAGTRTLTISGINTSAATSANLQLNFGYLTTLTSAQMVIETSIDGGANWSPLSFANNTTTGWAFKSIVGLPSSSSLSVRFTAPSTLPQSGMRIDDIAIINNATLAVADFNKTKSSFIKNTFVKNEEITFGADVKDVKVYNLSGAVVKTGAVKNGSTLNVAELQKGNYIVTGTVNNQPVSQKILKD
ncbi:T9SS type A sorting domain-containing protein [Chryseobacterium sp. 3008163]|uniref:T9SS type A sorting domain-containing protein n=1 Tax=Chryseobacterium sp. 3008163 TaxID=2478663 RepID=UPI000F0C513A|nr:T9SS type A sorting domain-containing protein [Chryseobacterium sp. 3008163]AYN00193.1 T9SS C-terminal target domain-containing protein [Chryseobacterium sp. 3008163]